MENRYNHIFTNGLRMGGLLGAISILLSLIYYIADFNMMNAVYGIVNYLVVIAIYLVVIAIYVVYLRWANIDLRNKYLNGWLTYPEGLLHAFLIVW